MPSLKQINDKTTISEPVKKGSILKTLFYILVIAGAIACGCWYVHQRKNIYIIPKKVYNTRNKSVFSRLMTTDKKKIFWFGGSDSDSIQQKRNIMYSIRYEKLDKYYEPQFYSMDEYSTSCNESHCLDNYITTKCSQVVCIYIPSKRQIILTDYDNMYDDMHKYKDL